MLVLLYDGDMNPVRVELSSLRTLIQQNSFLDCLLSWFDQHD